MLKKIGYLYMYTCMHVCMLVRGFEVVKGAGYKFSFDIFILKYH